MSVLIDMPMPENCSDCRLMVDGWCYCIKAEDWQSRKVEFEDRPDWCPLREVVRCVDCRYSEESYVISCVYCERNDRSCVKEGYCHRGERREE